MDRLQRVQNRAIRAIYRLDWCSPEIHALSEMSLIVDRLTEHGKKYVKKAKERNPYIATLISEYKDIKSEVQVLSFYYFLLFNYLAKEQSARDCCWCQV